MKQQAIGICQRKGDVLLIIFVSVVFTSGKCLLAPTCLPIQSVKYVQNLDNQYDRSKQVSFLESGSVDRRVYFKKKLTLLARQTLQGIRSSPMMCGARGAQNGPNSGFSNSSSSSCFTKEQGTMNVTF